MADKEANKGGKADRGARPTRRLTRGARLTRRAGQNRRGAIHYYFHGTWCSKMPLRSHRPSVVRTGVLVTLQVQSSTFAQDTMDINLDR
ncbi:hypothetical protein Ancab_034693, partial [Ancistrocladus abbreviatus]